MKEQAMIRISKDQKTLIVGNGSPIFVSTNLIKYLLDIPYTKKDGTLVSKHQIQVKKSLAKAKRISKVSEAQMPAVEF